MDLKTGISYLFSICLLIWNYNLQKKINKNKNIHEKEIEAIKNKYEKSTFVHKLQFEMEFNVFKEIWKTLIQIKLTLPELTKMFEWISPNQSLSDLNLKKVNKLIEAHNEFLNTFLNNKPFYPENIFKKLDEIAQKARHDIDLYTLLKIDKKSNTEASKNEDLELWNNLIKNKEEFDNLFRDVENLIRQRLKEVSIIEM